MMSLRLRALCDQIYGDGKDSRDILLVRSIEIAVTAQSISRRKIFRHLAYHLLEKEAYTNNYGPASPHHQAVALMEEEWKNL